MNEVEIHQMPKTEFWNQRDYISLHHYTTLHIITSKRTLWLSDLVVFTQISQAYKYQIE